MWLLPSAQLYVLILLPHGQITVYVLLQILIGKGLDLGQMSTLISISTKRESPCTNKAANSTPSGTGTVRACGLEFLVIQTWNTQRFPTLENQVRLMVKLYDLLIDSFDL